MKRNSGIIGPEIVTSRTEASGIFDLLDCNIARNDNTWPSVKRIVSTTNSGNSLFHYEGELKTFFFEVSGYDPGDIIYYSIVSVTGSISASDFTDNTLTGSFTLNSNNQGQFDKTLIRDLSNETESYKIQIRDGSVSGLIFGETNTFGLPQPSYTLTPSSSTINEGETITFTLSGTNAFEGTHYYSMSGSSLTSSDFSSLSGSFYYKPSNTGTFSITALEDFTTEGTETITIYARVNSISGPIVGQTNITINDTSITPTATCTPNVSNINEGSSVTFTVNTTNFPSGTLRWQSIRSNDMETVDISPFSGTVNISGSTGTIVITATSDGFTETGQTESFQVKIISPADNVSSLVTSSTVTINDTSTGTAEPSPPRLIVGAYLDDNPTNSGSVYVYDLDGTNQVKITASDAAQGDQFGWSVDTDNGKVVVGARQNDDNGGNSGSAYIFDSDGSNQVKITASDARGDDRFGQSVAVGSNRIVIGAPYDDNPNNSGRVYVYNLDGTNEVNIKSSDAGTYDRFGYSVAVGNNKVVVGAPFDDISAGDSGSVYVYNLDGTGETKIYPSDGGALSDNFGHSVAIGNNKIVVGAPNVDESGDYAIDKLNSGSVYVFNLDGTGEVKITASDAAEGDQFGFSVAISNNKIFVGAPNDDDNVSNSGSVYVYNLDGTGEYKINASDAGANDLFGYSIGAPL